MPISPGETFLGFGSEGFRSPDGASTYAVEPLYVAGRPATCANYGAIAPTTGTIIAIPYFNASDCIVTAIYMRLTVNGGVGTRAYFDVYTSSPDNILYPGLNNGVTTSLGVAVDTGAPATISVAPATPFSLSSGSLYWFVYTDSSSNLGVAAPTYVGIAAQGGPPFADVFNETFTAPASHLVAAYAHVDGTVLPDTFVAGAAFSNAAYPLIAISTA